MLNRGLYFRWISRGSCLAIAALLATPLASVQAGEMLVPEDRTGYSFISLQIGGAIPEPVKSTISNTAGAAFSGRQEVNFNSGIILDLLYGRYFTDRLHGTMKLTYSRGNPSTISNVSGFTGNPLAGLTVPAAGSGSAIGVAADVRYDFAKFDNGARLYAGGGVVVTRLTMKNLGPEPSPFHISDSDTAYALCALTGFSIPVARNLEFTAQYTAALVSGTSYRSTIGANTLTVSTRTDLRHIGTIGFRFLFN
jgi:hypothetical protein